jgi:hypothetical protein
MQKMSKILEIDITLNGSNPKIWRRVLVPAELNFYELHYVFQFAMGWTNSHLHQFIVGRRERCIGFPFEDDFGPLKTEDGSKVGIRQVLNVPGDQVLYEYDFGDGWQHLAEVKNVLEAEPGKTYPILTDGAMACPPENCGGMGGYFNLVEVMSKKDMNRYKEMLTWIGKHFDATAFDMEAINKTCFKDFKKKMKAWHKFAFG